jgi:hypothetical protein
MLDFEPGALIRGRAENSQVPMTQSQIGKSTRFRQKQGLFILANFGEPKLTVGTLVILEIFDGPIGRIYVNVQLVIESMARIFDVKAKVRDIVLYIIFTILLYVRPLDWTTDGYPSRRRFCLSAAHGESW